jgi:hypothetical protein
MNADANWTNWAIGAAAAIGSGVTAFFIYKNWSFSRKNFLLEREIEIMIF